MTVSSNILSHSYIPAGLMLAESLSNLHFLTAADLVVTLESGAVQVLGTDYEITGNGRTGTGSIRALHAYAPGLLLIITRKTDIIQEAATPPFTPLPSEEIERALDRRTMVEQELSEGLGDLGGRAIQLLDGQTMPPLDKATFAGKAVYGDGAGNFYGGTAPALGSDAALRADLANPAIADALVASPEAGKSMKEFRRRWLRYYEARETATISAQVTMAAGTGLVGNDAIVLSGAGHPGPVGFVITANVRFGGIDYDGTNLPAPTASWFVGPAKGSAVYGGGVDASNRISGMRIDGTFRNLKNGGINIEYAEDFDFGDLNFYNIQTDVTFELCSGLELYTCRDFTVGSLRFDGYRKKGINLSYCVKATVGKIVAIGGDPGHSVLHLTGGYLLDVGPITHDGGGTFGYTIKAWASEQLTVGHVQCRDVQEAIQCYGSHLHLAGLNSLNHAGACGQVDAYQARTAPQVTAECDFLCDGEYRAVRSTTSVTTNNALTVRTDPLTGCPILRCSIGSMYVRGHFSAISMPVLGGICDTFKCGLIDVDLLANGGYLYFGKFKNFEATFKVGSNVRNGIVAWTDADTIGGTFHLKGLECLQANSAWTNEPMIRVGYPGATSFSAGAFERIIIEDVFVDAANAANLKLIDLRLHVTDATREIVIRNIVGRNCVAAEQIRIELHGAATDVKLVLDNIDITNAAGTQMAITIINGNFVTSGYIGANVLAKITGRPAKCQPFFARHSVDLSGLASGATSGDQLVALIGALAGDDVRVVPANAGYSVVDLRVSAGNQIGFKVKNLTGGAGPNPALFDIFSASAKVG